MSVEKIDALINAMLESENIQPRQLFNDGECKDDLTLTFYSFLISRCIIRYTHSGDNYGMFEFSKPGRKTMENKIRRKAFIEEFLKFYEL